MVVDKALHQARWQLEAGVTQLFGGPQPRLVERLWHFAELLQRWRQVYNLTAIREPSAIVTHHLLDSLTLWPYVGSAPTLLDVGTGAGLPALPLALTAEELDAPLAQVVALDAVHKKIAFVQQCVIDLALRRLVAVAARLPAWRAAAPFAVITARALAPLADFVRLTEPLLAPEGRWLAMKGKVTSDEWAQLPSTVRVVDVIAVTVPFLDAQRHLVILERTR